MSRPTRHASTSAVFLILAACAAAAGCASPRPSLHVDVTFHDGERVGGRGVDQSLTLFTDAGRVVVPLSTVRAIDGNDDDETVTVRMADGGERRAVLESPSLELAGPRGAKPRTIDMSELRALRVTPRIRIAGSGDAWWDLSFVDALGFDSVNHDGRLTVRGIEPAAVNRGSHGTWAKVRLSRPVAALEDFALDARFSWDAEGAGTRAMKGVYVILLGADGEQIAHVGHHDAWDATTGSRHSSVAGAARDSGYGTEPASGLADLEVVRTGGQLSVLRHGHEQRTGVASAPVVQVAVQFEYYAYDDGRDSSVFGSATLERLRIRSPGIE